jgi:epsilon-lactone hydrolase
MTSYLFSEAPSPQFSKLYARLLERKGLGDGTGVEEQRAVMDAMSLPVADDVTVEQTSFAGLSAEWISAPNSARQAIVVFLHGGGFVKGSIATHRKLAGDVARASGAMVVLLDYPLAPEHRFPSAIESIAGAYREIQSANPSARLGFFGDSAGANLVISTMAYLLAQAHLGITLPVAAVAVSVWSDLVASGADATADLIERDPIVSPRNLQAMRAWYIDNQRADDPLASIARADLTGLPPLLLQVGDAEVLLEDSKKLAERAEACGVTVTLEIWPHMIHVWHAFAGRVPEATEAIDRAGQFLSRYLTAY